MSAVEYPIPRDWQVFEDLCRDVFAADWGDPHAQKVGRSGQKQAGVDIAGQRQSRWQGVQCKRKRRFPETHLDERTVRGEVEQALRYPRDLETLVIATTAPPDTKIQAVAGEISESHKGSGLFRVVVYGWSEICELIQRHPGVEEIWVPRLTGAPRRRRAARLVAALAAVAAIVGFAADIVGLQRAICQVPGIRAVCSWQGLGGVPTTIERAVWAARNPGDCAGLRTYLERFPTGALAQEAAVLLQAVRVEREERWTSDTRRYPLVVRHTPDPFVTEEAAREDALLRDDADARLICEPLDAPHDMRLIGTAPAIESWRCFPRDGGFVCGYDGVAVCAVEILEVLEREVCR